MIEAAVSILIVGGVLVVALNTVGASKRTQYLTRVRSRGQLLAQALMAEILSQGFEEPDAPDSFGLEAGEHSEKRDRYDDVDDYCKWSGSPPQHKNGQVIPGFEGWTRTATVVWVQPSDLTGSAGLPTGVKRITVTVKRGELVVASMVAVRTEAWPEDGDIVKVLFVVTNPGSLSPQELARKALMEEWGFAVTLINASAGQTAFDAAAAKADVAYVPEDINPADLGGKLSNATIGVVNEEAQLIDEFGFAPDWLAKDRNDVKIVDSTHYITSNFASGWLIIFSSLQPVWMLKSNYAPSLATLAEYHNVGGDTNNKPSLAVVEVGGELYGGGVAPGRRVSLPWGGDAFDINSLNESGRTIMKRAIEWAAGKEQEE